MAIARKRTKLSLTGTHLTIKLNVRNIIDPGEVTRTVDEIRSAIKESRAKVIVLDFSNVYQVSSQMLGQLLHLRSLAKNQDAELRICGMNGSVLKAFKVCRMQKVIPLFKDETHAIKDLTG